MPKCSSPKTFDRIRNRVRDLYRNHGAEIEKGHFIPQVGSIVFKEMKWLVMEIERLTGETEAVAPPPDDETPLSEERPVDDDDNE